MLQLAHADDCSATGQQYDGCLVLDGIATCRGLIKAFPADLPNCITRLDIIIDIGNKREFSPIVMESSQLFSHEMSHLEVIEIKIKDRLQYEHFIVKFQIGDKFFKGLSHLRELRVNTASRITPTKDAFQSVKTIHTLDFTRTTHLDLASFVHSIGSLKQNPIRSLMLKNVQSVSKSVKYNSSVDLSTIVCPLTSLKHLDLSHNDIVFIKMSSVRECYAYMLDTLDLSYNLITTHFTDTNPVGGYPMYNVLLVGLKVVHWDHMWSDHDADKNLWQDSRREEDDNQDGNQTEEWQVAQKTGLQLIVRCLEGWLNEMKEYCPSMNKKPNQLCLWDGFKKLTGDPCSLIECIFPSNNHNCQKHAAKSSIWELLSQTLKEQCSLGHCIGNTLLPLCSLTELYADHVSGRHGSLGRFYWDNSDGPKQLCFVQTNNLKVVDISYSEVHGVFKTYDDNYTEVQFLVTGLNKLQKFYLPTVSNPLRITLFSLRDAPALAEMHIGGNRLTNNDSQPLAASLQNAPNLKLLNLSDSNVQAFEYNALQNTPQMRILDLSHNRLRSENFLLNLSQTNLTQIILNDNNLDRILPDMQTQLDSLESLELDLQNNPLQCDCNAMDFVFWAHQAKQAGHIKFVGSENYFCVHTVGGSTLFTVNLAAMRKECNSWWKTVLIIGTTLLSALLVISIIMAVRKRWLIRHFLFTLQEKIQMSKENQQFENYQFDAFVLYSSELADRKWVHEQLVKTMEQTYGFKLCIHLRNFICGEDILDNVEMAIRKSRKVIAVLSPNFANSQWCLDELQMTRTIENEENRHKLIVVLLKDFPYFPANIPPVIRLMLESRTYLEWKQEKKAEKYFWKRLSTTLYLKKKPKPGEEFNVPYSISRQTDDQNVPVVQGSRNIEMLSFD